MVLLLSSPASRALDDGPAPEPEADAALPPPTDETGLETESGAEVDAVMVAVEEARDDIEQKRMVVWGGRGGRGALTRQQNATDVQVVPDPWL